MRGANTFTESLFTMCHLDDFLQTDHPLRPIRVMVNQALVNMDGLFALMFEANIKCGRPSVAPEKLLRAMLLQVFYSVRSERQLMDQPPYNLLLRRFIVVSMDDAVWVRSVFSKNRERMIEHNTVIELFYEARVIADKSGSLWGEHFGLDGTLIQAGPAIRALCAATAATMTGPTLSVRHAATTRTHQPPTPMPGCTSRATPPANCASRPPPQRQPPRPGVQRGGRYNRRPCRARSGQRADQRRVPGAGPSGCHHNAGRGQRL